MEIYEYKPSGVCSTKMIFKIENNKVLDLEVIDGCSGNIKQDKVILIFYFYTEVNIIYIIGYKLFCKNIFIYIFIIHSKT